jgi:non-heme Fe2+,alpha-ketoglutarate-dependent halogenase
LRVCFLDDSSHANIAASTVIAAAEQPSPPQKGGSVCLLSADSISEFHKSGFSNPLSLASEAEMSLIRDDLDTLMESEKAPETFYSAIAPDEGPDVPVETIYNAHQRNSRVTDLTEKPIAWAEALLCGPVRVWRTTFWIKSAGARRVEWHQDTYKDENLGSFPNVNAWIAIDDAAVENCLAFVAGTHKSIIPLERFHAPVYLESLRSNGDLPNPPVGGATRQVPLRPGECVLFDGRVLHGSPPNRTSKRRAGLVVRFVPRDLELRHKNY